MSTTTWNFLGLAAAVVPLARVAPKQRVQHIVDEEGEECVEAQHIGMEQGDNIAGMGPDDFEQLVCEGDRRR